MDKRKWFTVAEAGDYFKLNAKTIYSLIGRNRFPRGSVLRIGRQIRLDVRKIENQE